MSGPGWCNVNAPAPTDLSYVQCDDFDTGQLQSIFGYAGVARSSLVATHYVSAYCALQVVVEDGGVANAAAFGSYTEHPYSSIPATGPATLAFDLYVSGGSACNGASVARFEAQSESAQRGDQLGAWLTISNIEGSGAVATGYTLGLTLLIGLTGTPTTPVTVQVSPKESDGGWTRLGMDLSSYSFATPTGTITGKPTWAYRGSTGAPVGTSSSAASGTGSLASSSALGNMVFDVGLPPGPTSTLTSGCTLYVDDFVSNLPPVAP